jgi:glyoxylase-like metal-dependent hydrolase (beta-lactamase superfamily II)
MEIVPHIHQVDGINANCYIIAREHLTVIDTGIRGSGKKILAYIRDTMHRDPAEISTLVLTHFHMDHTGGIAAIRVAAPGAKLACHEAEAGYLSGDIPTPKYPGIKGMFLRIGEMFMGPEPVRPDILLHDRDRIDGLLCVHTPGHTPGSIGLLDEESKVFFAGDTIRYNGKTLTPAPPPFTLDPARQDDAIRRIAALEFDTLLVGHGVPLRPGASAKVREFAGTLPQKEP